MELSRKAQRIEASVTLAITAKAKEMKESGIDVISFGAGEPDFNTPQNIINAAIKAMEDGNTKYTNVNGILPLREAICKKFKDDNGLIYNPSQIVVSTGAKQSLANAFLAILNPGDEVIVPNPYWVSYPELIGLADGKAVFVESNETSSYKFTKENLEKAVTEKTKAIILNTPNNPTGTIYSKEELMEIAEFAKKYNLIIVSDEMYEKLIYDGEEHVSIASVSDDAYERTIVINGLSKSYAMTGWRLGYCGATEKISKLMTNIQSHMTSNVCSITQYAAVEALNGPQDKVKEMISEFERRRNYMVKTLEEMNNLSIIKPQGAFYIMINIDKCLGKEINGEKITDSMDFSAKLLEHEKVAVIPGKAFGLDNYVRVSYATSMELIEKGLERINKFVNKLK
ncbi:MULTISPECIES: pyridoxal phosphate-dependent aminotransferase [unclassified Clostridium]|uniref:pyridoxal phosphate-dependent aminotransferase n=1 Tax=unclassified Clostridium TaxID=2614128 RepID=UPI00189B95CE|nr:MULTISPECIES: pyridoxal phosphate-dependent aminotransferase [unclassified Clostridium]MBP3915865.1 pyridoxal phosphate-dependent aminotransferase [Clostridium sp.]MEE0932123.1 pyridoxal phosphate-dependent aminotransferase [Clostridium sp.]